MNLIWLALGFVFGGVLVIAVIDWVRELDAKLRDEGLR